METRVNLVLLFLMNILLAKHVVQGMSEEMAEMVKMLHDQCIDETGADEDLIVSLNKGETIPEGDPKLKCYMKCIMVTAGVMSDGAVDVETAVAMLPEEIKAKTEPVMRSCGTKKGADDCETAFLTNVCYQQSAPEAYFLI